MVSEILSTLQGSNVLWMRGMDFLAPYEAPISSEFEGGMVLPYFHNHKYEFAVLKRFEGAEAKPYRVRIQKVVGTEGDLKRLVVLDHFDCAEEEIQAKLAALYKSIPLYESPKNENQ